MKSVRLFSILAVAIAAMFCISMVSVQYSSAEGVDNDQGTVTYYTYTVNFQFQGTDAQSILWEFGFNDGNGNPVTSTEWNPSGIVFPAKGIYTVVQTVSNSVGSFVSQLKLCIMGTPEITFDSNGGSAVDMQLVKVGNKIIEPASPEKEGFVFAGWYKESSLLNKYDFSQTVTQHMTLYAKWITGSSADDGDTEGGNDDGNGDNENDGAEPDNGTSLTVGSFELTNGIISILILVAGAVCSYLGNKKGSKFITLAGIVVMIAGAVCLFTGFDIIGSFSTEGVKE